MPKGIPALPNPDSTRTCTKCGETYPDSLPFFRFKVSTGRTESQCVSCRDGVRKGIYKRWRMAALVQYGGVTPACSCCGETTLAFLAIDHKDGGGNVPRRLVSTAALPKWLHDNGWPVGYRVLCHNCNQAHGILGYCPHDQPHTPRISSPDLAAIVARIAAAERAAG